VPDIADPFQAVETPEQNIEAPAEMAKAWLKDHPLPDRPLDAFDRVEEPERPIMGLEVARQKARQAPREDLADFLTNRSMPLGSAVLNFGIKNAYAGATKRVQSGEATGDDLQMVAGYEEAQKREQQKGIGESILSGVAHIPAIIGEGMVGGGFIRGGAAATLAGRGAVTAGEVAAGITLRGTVAAAPAWAARTAAQTVLMPSMYLPQSADRAIQNGTDWYKLENLGPAYAIGTAQVGLLGGISQGPAALARGMPETIAGRMLGGTTLAAWGTRLAVGTGVGMTGQQAIDTGATLAGWETGYGMAGQLVQGKEGALKHALVQASVFAVFSALHAHHDPVAQVKQATAVQQDYTQSLRSKGYTEAEAGQDMQAANKALMAQIRGEKPNTDSLSEPALKYVKELGKVMNVEQLAAEQKAKDAQLTSQPPESAVNAPESTPAEPAQPATEPAKAPEPQAQAPEAAKLTPEETAALAKSAKRLGWASLDAIPEKMRVAMENEVIANRSAQAARPTGDVEGLDPGEADYLRKMGFNEDVIAQMAGRRTGSSTSPEPTPPTTSGEQAPEKAPVVDQPSTPEKGDAVFHIPDYKSPGRSGPGHPPAERLGATPARNLGRRCREGRQGGIRRELQDRPRRLRVRYLQPEGPPGARQGRISAGPRQHGRAAAVQPRPEGDPLQGRRVRPGVRTIEGRGGEDQRRPGRREVDEGVRPQGGLGPGGTEGDRGQPSK
jgi:hypothetical protein